MTAYVRGALACGLLAAACAGAPAEGNRMSEATPTYGETTTPDVVAEEVVAPLEEWDNGAGPTWDFGSRNIVRDGDTVYLSLSTPDPASRPYHNVFWNLYRRTEESGWERVADAGDAREREPCPIVRLSDGKIVLSTTPFVDVSGRHDGGIETTLNDPMLLVFNAADPSSPPDTMHPQWAEPVHATEHSYRGLAADRATGALLVTQQVRDELFDTYSQAYAYLGEDGEWSAAGTLRFPMRGCYPAIAVAEGAVHVVAVSDEVEPNEEWREYKREVTGRRWDYEFRQLFYTWTPDITSRPFSPPLTIDSADETAGQLTQCDIWLSGDGTAYVLYTYRNVWHAFMRDRYWPDLPIRVQLKLAVIKDGRVVNRRILATAVEDMNDSSKDVTFTNAAPTFGNLQATPDGRLFAIWNLSDGHDAGMYIQRILPEEPGVGPIRMPIEVPLSRFFNAAERAGSLPSTTVDIMGHPANGASEMRYLQIHIK